MPWWTNTKLIKLSFNLDSLFDFPVTRQGNSISISKYLSSTETEYLQFESYRLCPLRFASLVVVVVKRNAIAMAQQSVPSRIGTRDCETPADLKELLLPQS